MKYAKDRYRHARALGYRSGLEVSIARQLEEAGVEFKYEPFAIKYTQPAKVRRYTPDYALPNGIVIETKGRFLTEDRKKHKDIKACYPELDLRFVFANSNTCISKISKTTYAKWCETNGFQYADKEVPEEWINEPAWPKRRAAIGKAMRGELK